MKKIFGILLIIICFFITACTSTKKTDAEKFKEEYESVNGEEVNGNTSRSLSIDEENPFIYKTAEEIVEMINNKESFVVYFGFSTCPWCRSVLPALIESASNNNLSKIYYVDIKDIRDTLYYNEETKTVESSKEGSDGYNQLLILLNDVLKDYTVKDVNDNEMDTGEKRIYAPSVVAVVYGKAESLTTGISDLLTDPYMEITDEIRNESVTMFDEVIKKVTGNGTCVKDSGC